MHALDHVAIPCLLYRSVIKKEGKNRERDTEKQTERERVKKWIEIEREGKVQNTENG